MFIPQLKTECCPTCWSTSHGGGSKAKEGKEEKHSVRSRFQSTTSVSPQLQVNTPVINAQCAGSDNSEYISISHGRRSLLRLNHSRRGQLRVSHSEQEVRQNKRAAGFNTTWLVLSREPSVMSESGETQNCIGHVKTLRFCRSAVLTGRKPDLERANQAGKGLREADGRYEVR